MISELRDDEILEFLMTSEFEDDYSPSELKYLLIKWRYFYRVQNGTLERKSVDFEGKIQQLETKIKSEELKNFNLLTQLADKQNTIDSMKNRHLTFKERWTGKIIQKENED